MSEGLEFRPVRPDEMPQLERSLRLAFAVGAGKSFFDDFPVWADIGANGVTFIGCFDGDRLVSVAGGRRAEAWVARRPEGDELSSPVKVPVGIVGAVATSPEYRGRGLATKCVAGALGWLEGAGTLFQVLWGAEHDLYRRLGFELCGEQMRIPLAGFLDSARASGARIDDSRVQEGWNPAIFEIRRGFGEGLALGEEDRAWYSRHATVSWFWSGPAEKPAAYAAYGRGIDLEGIAHEWGGERSALLSVLGRIQRLHPDADLLANPDVLSSRGLPIPEAAEEYLCMARVSAPEELCRRVGLGGDVIARAESPHEVSEMLFGPEAPLTPEGDAYIPGYPLVFWMWGLDAA